MKEEGAHPVPRARNAMATTLGPRCRLPQDHDRTDREPVVLADALGDVMAALGELAPELLPTRDTQTGH